MSILDALDVETLQLCSLLASGAFAFMFFFVWWERRDGSHLLHWAASSILYAALLLAFHILRAQPLVVGAILDGGLAASNALILAGVYRFEGQRPFRSWMALPIAAAMLIHAVPRLMIADGLPLGRAVLQAGDSVGLATSFLVFGLALLAGGGRTGTCGRRITGVALLAYLPAYAGGVAGSFLCPDALLLPKLPMLADQLLLSALNLGLLAMVAERAQQQLRETALRDPLTGVWNRGGLQALEPRLARPGTQVLAIDVDHFKLINDAHGHAAGDHVLLALANEAARVVMGEAGEIARLGGDEFLAVLPGFTRDDASRLADRLRLAVGQADQGLPRWTVSLGWAAVLDGERTLAPAIARADASLYRAKAAGRDRLAA